MPSASAFLRAVSGAAVLRPDAALDALSEAACDDARALLEEATGASLPFARGPADGPPPLRVHFTRSLRDARARWLAAWKTLGSSLWAHDSGFFSKETAPAGPLFTAAWETFFRAHALPADERAGLDRELRAACAAVRATAGVPPSAGLGFEELLGLELAWQATSASRDEASPWAPLWALWQRGAWPAWLGGASWVVYVPLRDAAGRVEEPEELDGALAHATEQSVRVHAASALMELGLAPAGRERSVQRGYFVEHRAGSVVPLGVVCGLGRVRDPSVHIAIPSGNVSKRQCTVLWGDEPRRHVLSDARSTGGTWLNEARVGAPTALAQGDRVSFGDHAFSSWFAPALGDEERARGLSSPGALSLVPHEGTPARRLLRGAPRGGPAVDAAPAGDPGPVRSFIARVLDQSRGRSGVHRLGLLAERLLDEPWGGGGPRPDGAEAEALAALSEGLAAWPSALRDEWPVPPVWDRGARPAPALPVERAPSLRAFFERFHAAWDAAARRPFDPACAWPLFAMQRVNRPTGYSAWGEREARFLAGVDGASSVWSGPARARLRALGSRYARDPSPGAEFALRLVRKCSSGVTLAPWQPLLDAWLAGLWPALVPGPAVLVYPFASARNEPPGPGPLPAPARAGGGGRLLRLPRARPEPAAARRPAARARAADPRAPRARRPAEGAPAERRADPLRRGRADVPARALVHARPVHAHRRPRDGPEVPPARARALPVERPRRALGLAHRRGVVARRARPRARPRLRRRAPRHLAHAAVPVRPARDRRDQLRALPGRRVAGRRRPPPPARAFRPSFRDPPRGPADAPPAGMSTRTAPAAKPPPSPTPAELPRERLRRLGAPSLSDAELLSLVLGTGRRGEPVWQLAVRALAAHGGARGLARAGVGPLAAGLGEARAARIVGAFELARRALSEPLARAAPYGTSRDVARAYGPRLADRVDECVLAVVLDVKQRPIAERVVATGGPAACTVAVRDVFALAVREGGAALLLVHNHPSGDPTPSPDDEYFTRALVEAGRWLDLPLLDHVIVGREGAFSFLDAGLLRPLPLSSPPASTHERSAPDARPALPEGGPR